MSETVISVQNLYKSYGPLKAVDGIDFEVSGSSCYGFLGPNGAGKTTTMKVVYGKNERDPNPDSSVQVLGYDPQTCSLEIKYESGVVPQENNLDEELNVTQNLQIYGRFYGMSKKERADRIQELLEFFELSDKAKSKIRELSGGMKRRLIIARALMHHPKLLILDEPTTGLDPQVRHLIWEKLRQLKREGLTILLTTHYMEEAFQLCDQICIMDKGKIILRGTPGKLLKDHIESYVLEILDENIKMDQLFKKDKNKIREDTSLNRPIFYSNDFNSLKEIADRMDHGEYYLRQSNLEDLFLKMTGRQLHEQQ